MEILTIQELDVFYGAAQALFEVDLGIKKGDTIALVGANGAGKTTLLHTIMGICKPARGKILLEGKNITGLSTAKLVKKGLALSPEGREMFSDLSVRENLTMATLPLKLKAGRVADRMEAVFNRFPRLKERLDQKTGTLSGGEQQMVSMGRALMTKPALLLLDEPSLGLAPIITDEIFDIIRQLTRSGTTILLVEQNAARALTASKKAYLLANGRVIKSGFSKELLTDPDLRRVFLGSATKGKPESSRLGAAGLTNIRLEKPDMVHQTFLPQFKTSEELQQIQLNGLKWTVQHAYTGSAYYHEKLEKAGISPDDIRSLDDLKRLPFTSADDLRDGYPFPLRAVPFEQITRIHASSGTTGKRKVMCYTQKDIDDWFNFFARAYEMIGITPLDRIQIAVGYGVWTAGMGFQMGCERIGAMALPTGPGNVDLQIQFLLDFQPTVFCSTASMALLMAEEIHKRNIAEKINIQKVIYGSERSSVAMRKKISNLFGGAELFDIPGLTELYGPGTGIECPEHDCIHYWGDYYILEIVDPETLEPLPDGEWGEMVVTTLRKEGAPLIRYRTRDITRIIPEDCTCGSLLRRHSRIRGRSDDMFTFRGVNIYPSSVDKVLSDVPGLGSEYQIHLSRDENSGKDSMKLVIEQGENATTDRVPLFEKETIHGIKTRLLVTPEVEIVAYGSLPRSVRKSQRVFDNRITDAIVES